MTKAKEPSAKSHPLMKFFHLHLRVENVSLAEACRRAGVSYNTAKEALQGRSNISLASTEALLNVFGYSVKATPMKVGP